VLTLIIESKKNLITMPFHHLRKISAIGLLNQHTLLASKQLFSSTTMAAGLMPSRVFGIAPYNP